MKRPSLFNAYLHIQMRGSNVVPYGIGWRLHNYWCHRSFRMRPKGS